MSVFTIWRYNVMANERECGYNPLKMISAQFNELWCICGDYEYYGGFSCMTCERLCEKYDLGKNRDYCEVFKC